MNPGWKVAFAVLALGACGQGSGATASDDARDVAGHIDALQAEQTAHSIEIGSLSTLDALHDPEVLHWRRVEGHLDAMNLGMSDMMACDSDRIAIVAAGFADSMQKMHVEFDAHRHVILGAGEMGAARIEEARHGEAVRDITGAMQDRWNTMMLDPRAYACPRCSSCGM